MTEQQVFVDLKRARRNLLIGLIAAIVGINTGVLFTVGSDMETAFSDISRIGTIGAAAALSVVVVSRQKASGLFGRAYVALAIGLISWVAAESIWGYYELVLGIETPFPSIADAFWLFAYLPIGYHMFSTAKFFGKGVKKSTVVLVVVAAAMFLAFYIQEIVNVSELEGTEALTAFAISIAYPIFDAILIVPAVLMVTNAGRGQLTSIPWIFVAMILLIVADSLLGLTQVTNFTGALFHITMTYNASYLCFMAGLIWYNKQFIHDEKRLKKMM
jgi:hypothetical protein